MRVVVAEAGSDEARTAERKAKTERLMAFKRRRAPDSRRMKLKDRVGRDGDLPALMFREGAD